MDHARQRIPRNSNNQPQALTVWIATDVIHAETVTKAQGPGGKSHFPHALAFLYSLALTRLCLQRRRTQFDPLIYVNYCIK